jgi:hypothetical protein
VIVNNKDPSEIIVLIYDLEGHFSYVEDISAILMQEVLLEHHGSKVEKLVNFLLENPISDFHDFKDAASRQTTVTFMAQFDGNNLHV